MGQTNETGSCRFEQGSSIADELREYVNSNSEPYYGGCAGGVSIRELLEIADRIDEQHAVKVERLEKYRAAVDAMLKEYVKLPVDADGVPIHVGDEMDVGIVFAIGDEGVFMVENGFSGKYDVECFDGFACHHVQPDSWERIIQDAVETGFTDPDNEHLIGKLVERCRRLADA